MKQDVKIWFPFENYDGEWEVESIWAEQDGVDFVLDNIPFYVKNVAYRDRVAARATPRYPLEFVSLVQAGGHSTIRIIVYNKPGVPNVCKELTDLGCSVEIADVKTLVAVDIPPHIEYRVVKRWLEAGKARGEWGYEEACLAQDE